MGIGVHRVGIFLSDLSSASLTRSVLVVAQPVMVSNLHHPSLANTRTPSALFPVILVQVLGLTVMGAVGVLCPTIVLITVWRGVSAWRRPWPWVHLGAGR